MASIKCENMWKLLTNYNLQFEIQLPDDFKCGICNKILVNAHQSPCTCRFCLECISSYLNGEERFCPGSMEDCKECKLNLNKDIHIDYVINKKISMLQVKCPNPLCQLVLALKDLDEHLTRDHLINCPFTQLGCSKTNTTAAEMANHFQSQYYSHSVMMIEYMDRLKDEFSSIKVNWSAKEDNLCDKTFLKSEIKKIMKYIHETDSIKFGEIDRLKASLDQCLIENLRLKGHLQIALCNINDLKEDIQRIQQNIGGEKGDADASEFKKDFSLYKNDQNRLIDEMKTRKSEIKMINDNLQLKQKLILELEKRIEEFILEDKKIIHKASSREDIQNSDNVETENEIKYKTSKKELYQKMLGELLNDLKEPRTTHEINKIFSDMLDKEVDNTNINCEIQTNTTKYNIVPFDWKIEKFSKKWKLAREGTDPYIMSGDFYSYRNGYKMILGVYPDGFDTGQGSYLSVFFHIAKGEDDDKLSWPMRHELSISLINQDTGYPHTTEKFRYKTAEKSFLPSYHKPKSAINLGYGDIQFIDLLTLFNNRHLLKNDSIIIRCSMEINDSD